MDWEAVGAVAGGVAAVIGIPAAVAAFLTARQAKRQAEAAENQADAALRMAKLAESEQQRATQPRLRVGRWSGGGDAMVQINGPSGDWRQQEVSVYVENLRDAAAELENAYLNDHAARLSYSRAEKRPGADHDHLAIAIFPIEAVGPPGDIRAGPHTFRAAVRVPDTGQGGTFTAEVYLQGGTWHAAREQLNLDS